MYNKNSKISEIEKKYDISLGVRSDMKITTYLKKIGFKNLSKLIS